MINYSNGYLEWQDIYSKKMIIVCNTCNTHIVLHYIITNIDILSITKYCITIKYKF